MYISLESTSSIQALKFLPNIKQYIQTENIWIKIDWYDTKTESSPGFITQVNPKLIEKNNYVRALTEILKTIEVNSDEQCVQKWRENVKKHDEHNDQTVPKFHVEQSSRKWGKLKTEVLRINCAEEDAQYLKYLLSTASAARKVTQGLFIPTGIHLMEGKEVLTSILNEQEQYLQSTIGIPITGISTENMKTSRNGNKSVEHVLMSSKLVQSVEPTNLTDKIGKWILIVHKEKQIKVMEYLKNNMIKLYRNQHGQNRIIRVSTDSGKKRWTELDNTGISTYAAVLMRRYSTKNTTQQVQDIPTANKDPNEPNLDIPPDGTSEGSLDLSETDNQTGDNKTSKKAPTDNEALVTQTHDYKQNDQTLTSRTHRKDNSTSQRHIAEQLLRLEQLHNKLDEKLQILQSEQTNQKRQIEQKIHEVINKKTEQTIKTMSDIVATSVTSQLLDVMKSMMSEHKNNTTETNGRVLTEKSQTYSSDSLAEPRTDNRQGYIARNIPQRSTTNDMLNALPIITPRTLNTSSNHDKSSELCTSHK